jgi:EpsI family protein
LDVSVPDPDGRPTSININRYVVSKGDYQSVVLYWYQSQGRVIADEFAAKFYLISDSIRKHRSDTALVRVVVPVVPGHIDLADKTATDFVQAMYPVVRSYLPH